MTRQVSNTSTSTPNTWWLKDKINRFLFITRHGWINPFIILTGIIAFNSVLLLPQYIESYINNVRWVIEDDSSWTHSKTTRYVCSKAISIICWKEVTIHNPWKRQIFRIWDKNEQDYNLPSDEDITSFIETLRKFIEKNPEINSITIEWKYYKDSNTEIDLFSNESDNKDYLALKRANYIKAKIEEQAPELIPLISSVLSRTDTRLISLEEIVYPIMIRYWIHDFQDFMKKYIEWEIELNIPLDKYTQIFLWNFYDKRIEVTAKDTIWNNIVETDMSPDFKKIIPSFLLFLLIWFLFIHNSYKSWLQKISRLLQEAKNEDKDELEKKLFGDKLEEFKQNNIIFAEKLKEVKEWDVIIISDSEDFVFWYQKNNWIWKRVKQRNNTSKIVNWQYWVYNDEECDIEDEYELFLVFNNYKVTPDNMIICSIEAFNDLISKKIKKD